MTPPRGRVGSRSGVDRGCHRPTNRIQSSVVQPSKRTSGVSKSGASIAAACYVSRNVDAEELFVRFFLPLYPADARASLATARTADANPAGNPTLLGHLDEAAARFDENARALFGAEHTELALDRTDASVHRLKPLPSRRSDGTGGSPGERPAARATCSSTWPSVHGAAYEWGRASFATTKAAGACAGRCGRASFA